MAAASEFLADARWPVQKGHEEPSRVRLTIVALQTLIPAGATPPPRGSIGADDDVGRLEAPVLRGVPLARHLWRPRGQRVRDGHALPRAKRAPCPLLPPAPRAVAHRRGPRVVRASAAAPREPPARARADTAWVDARVGLPVELRDQVRVVCERPHRAGAYRSTRRVRGFGQTRMAAWRCVHRGPLRGARAGPAGEAGTAGAGDAALDVGAALRGSDAGGAAEAGSTLAAARSTRPSRRRPSRAGGAGSRRR